MVTCLRGRVGSPGVTPGHAVDSTWRCTKLRDQEFREGPAAERLSGARGGELPTRLEGVEAQGRPPV